MNQFIGIEGGGTKFVCVHGSNPDNLRDRTVIKTQTPELTMKEVIHYIHTVKSKTPIKALGVAIFGPLDLDITSPTYGYITAAAKPGWKNYNIVGALEQACNLPIGFDTDVNGAALGEHRWGAARDLQDFLYLTVGTGIGGGVMANGKMLHGAMHPEMGHIRIPQDHTRDNFAGSCSYHQNCFEGLASGTAMKTRWHVESALDLAEDHIAWDLEARYLAAGIANYILTLSPKRVIIGGGVMKQVHLLPRIRAYVLESLNGYLACEKITNNIHHYIVTPQLKENAGICGAIALAEQSVVLGKSFSIAQKLLEEA